MRAFCLIRAQPWYRREAFAEGLKASGHQVMLRSPDRFDAETLLVIWNRYSENHALAQMVERGGGRVLVAENGYLAKGGGTPKFDVYTKEGGQGGHFYALAEGWHNGGGRWPAYGLGRWEALGIPLAPWRTDGEYVLVCPNRSFGVPGRTLMDIDWAKKAAAEVRKQTALPVKIRPHPGNDRPARPLEDDLKCARAVVIWSSSAGVHALIHGIPVICHAPYWICKQATFGSFTQLKTIGEGYMEDERLAALGRLAYAQWTVEEIASGEPFRSLLS